MGPVGYFWKGKTSSTVKRKDHRRLDNGEEGDAVIGGVQVKTVAAALSAIQPPQTPHEPMEFLSRSWSVTASEISKAILSSNNKKRDTIVDRIVDGVRPTETLALAIPYRSSNGSLAIARRGSVGGWFGSSGHGKNSVVKKERARSDRAQTHAAVSVAGVAAAVAAVAAGWFTCPDSLDSLMTAAMASATELLASHFIEIAEQSGANRNGVVSVVQSAVDVRTAGDLMTLTAGAATALRAAAALKHRIQREGGSPAAVVPYGVSPDFFCKEGLLLKRTRRGALHWKQVTIYINKKSQVIVKLKSKHIGGAFSKRKSCVVYGVYENIPAWPGRGGKCGGEGGVHFGLSTAQGIIEFECENETQKQKWVDGVRNLLHQACGG